MFSSMKRNNTGSSEIETIIGKNTQLKGNINGAGNIRIDGKLDGEIRVQGDVVIGESGEVVAQVKAENLLISGIVKGNVEVDAKLEILGSGKLYGDVRAKVLSIAEGAVFKGSSHMESQKEEIGKESAPAAAEKKHN